MADDETALARKAFDRWASGDWEPRAEELDPDIVIASHVAGRSLTGYGGVRQWANDLRRSFDEYAIQADEWRRADDGRILAIGRLRLRGRKSGETIDRPCAWLFECQGGRIVRVEAFHGRVEEALSTAGLAGLP